MVRTSRPKTIPQ